MSKSKAILDLVGAVLLTFNAIRGIIGNTEPWGLAALTGFVGIILLRSSTMGLRPGVVAPLWLASLMADVRLTDAHEARADDVVSLAGLAVVGCAAWLSAPTLYRWENPPTPRVQGKGSAEA